MPINTKYDPQNLNNFEKSKLNKNAQGLAMTVNMDTVTNLDLTLTEDHLITSGFLLVKDGAKGDYVEFLIMFGDNQIAKYITTWYVNPDNVLQNMPKSFYPAKLVAGLTLRAVYHSTSETIAPWVAINYDMDKVLE